MAKLNIPDQDSKLRQWLSQFSESAALHQAELGLTNDEVEALEEAAAEFSAAYGECEIYRNLARGKTRTKDMARERAEALFRSIGKVILVDSNIGPQVKADLGMNPGDTPASQIAPPTQLAAVGYSNGENRLSWQRNGNSVHTMFLIEALKGTESEWKFIAATTRVRFVDRGQKPGQRVIYRVRSQRGRNLSAPSNTAMIYSNGEERTISLPKAA